MFYLLLFLFLVSNLGGQTQLNLGRQAKNLDFRSLGPTYPFQVGTILPQVCGVGSVYFRSDAPGGQNLYLCFQNNSWAPSGTALNVLLGGQNVGQRSVVDFTAGPGTTVSAVDTGSAIAVSHAVDLNVVQSRASAQANISLRCRSQSSSGSLYTCSLNPTLSVYSNDMVLYWTPDIANTGTVPSLNVDTLGATPLKKADGVSSFVPGELAAGQMFPIWYDGSSFRVLTSFPRHPADNVTNCASSGASGSAYTCSATPSLPSVGLGSIIYWKPDVGNSTATPTLAIDALGVKDILQADGVSTLEAGSLIAGAVYTLWHDGLAFRLLTPIAPLQQGAIRPSCVDSLRGRVWFQRGATMVEDSLAICAKDASDNLSWRNVY